MTSARVIVDGREFVLAASQDLVVARRAVHDAVRYGGGFVELTLVRDERLSLFANIGLPILFIESDASDDRDARPGEPADQLTELDLDI